METYFSEKNEIDSLPEMYLNLKNMIHSLSLGQEGRNRAKELQVAIIRGLHQLPEDDGYLSYLLIASLCVDFLRVQEDPKESLLDGVTWESVADIWRAEVYRFRNGNVVIDISKVSPEVAAFLAWSEIYLADILWAVIDPKSHEIPTDEDDEKLWNKFKDIEESDPDRDACQIACYELLDLLKPMSLHPYDVLDDLRSIGEKSSV